jgi:hypothetical protein
MYVCKIKVIPFCIREKKRNKTVSRHKGFIFFRATYTKTMGE